MNDCPYHISPHFLQTQVRTIAGPHRAGPQSLSRLHGLLWTAHWWLMYIITRGSRHQSKGKIPHVTIKPTWLKTLQHLTDTIYRLVECTYDKIFLCEDWKSFYLEKYKNITYNYISSNNLRQMQKYKVYLPADVDSLLWKQKIGCFCETSQGSIFTF